ncbi:MAG: c-type cytochrome [Cyclobacteriaceae bacterium]|nr:c-type cytochrome [Cyclobacteriaceae bacterium]
MQKILSYVLFAIGFVIVTVAGLFFYVKFALPNVGEAENITIPATSEQIERGKYLANAVAVCMDCHSTRDWSKFSGPLTPGTLGQGGERFDHSMGLPGIFYSKNITPSAISRYTDGELYRVITTGVTKEGRAMFPLMPYLYYGKMDKEDIYAIIAYLRTIPSLQHEVPSSNADFPVNVIMNTIPTKAQPQTKPAPSDMLAYGAYMTNAAACMECHTKVNDQGQVIPEVAFGGGRAFQYPDGSVVTSSNITSDAETGIGNWSEEAFVQRFKTYADSSYVTPAVAKGEFQTVMPWTMYAQMKREDLVAIYNYLKTVKPINQKIVKFTASR